MPNVRVKSIGATLNGQPIGTEHEIAKAEADHYASLGYVEILGEVKPAKQTESAPSAGKDATPKKPTRKRTKDDK